MPYVRYGTAVLAGTRSCDTADPAEAADPAVALGDQHPDPGFTTGCPAPTRIVAQADGGLARIHLRGGRLTAEQAERLAALAGGLGTGVIELTNRGNVQLRGLRPRCHAELRRGLARAGCAVDDAWSGVFVVPPLAGIDPADPAGSVALEAELRHAAAVVDRSWLSPKFGVLIDGGARFGLRHRRFDVAVGLLPGDPAHCRVALGVPLVAGGPHAANLLTIVRSDAARFVGRVLDQCAQLAAGRGQVARVADLIESIGVDGVVASSGVVVIDTPEPGEAGPGDGDRGPVGVRPQADASLVYVAGVAELGRLSAPQMHGLAGIARDGGRGELRVTPWRSVVVPHVDATRGDEVLGALEAVGLHGAAGHPSSRVIACSGATGCVAGLSDTQADGLDVIGRLAASASAAGAPGHAAQPGDAVPIVHLSGCGKRCARRDWSGITLVAVAPHRYDAFRSGAGAGRVEQIARGADFDTAMRLVTALEERS